MAGHLAISYIKAFSQSRLYFSRKNHHKSFAHLNRTNTLLTQPFKTLKASLFFFSPNNLHPLDNAFPLPHPRCRGHHLQRQCPQLLEIRSDSLGRQHLTQHQHDMRLSTEPRLPPQRRALPMRAGSCWCEVGLCLDGKRFWENSYKQKIWAMRESLVLTNRAVHWQKTIFSAHHIDRVPKWHEQADSVQVWWRD